MSAGEQFCADCGTARGGARPAASGQVLPSNTRRFNLYEVGQEQSDLLSLPSMLARAATRAGFALDITNYAMPTYTIGLQTFVDWKVLAGKTIAERLDHIREVSSILPAKQSAARLRPLGRLIRTRDEVNPREQVDEQIARLRSGAAGQKVQRTVLA